VPGGQHADVEVAVADVPEPDHLEAWILPGEQRIGAREERRDLANTHRDVVLVGAMAREALGDSLAQAPQFRGLRLALADHAVARQTGKVAFLENRSGTGRVFV